jgi:predicted nucleotidyltransferase
MRSLPATQLRKELFDRIDQIVRTRVPIEVLRFGRPVAVLAPAPSMPPARRKPPLDLDAIADFCRRYDVDAFSLFGSILRDDFDESSDVDVLLDTRREPGFHETCRMLDELEAMFGRKVDMLTRRAVESPETNPHRRAHILSSARLIYERRR